MEQASYRVEKYEKVFNSLSSTQHIHNDIRFEKTLD